MRGDGVKSTSARRLILMRHCKSDWRREDLDDFDRPLARRGRRDARRIGGLLPRLGLQPDLLVASPAARSKRTAQIVADRSGYGEAIRWIQDLYNAEPDTYLAALRTLEERFVCPLVVGHNPALEELVTSLTGGRVRIPTGGLILLEAGSSDRSPARWADLEPGSFTLVWQLVPRLVRKIAR